MDIVERLRQPVMLHSNPEQTNAERREAAAEIEKLRRTIFPPRRGRWRVGMAEWQPIETAPKDGTDFLMCHQPTGDMLAPNGRPRLWNYGHRPGTRTERKRMTDGTDCRGIPSATISKG